MQSYGRNSFMFHMHFLHHIIQRRFADAVCQARRGIHLSYTRHVARHSDKLWVAGLLEERPCGLEEEQRGNGVDREGGGKLGGGGA